MHTSLLNWLIERNVVLQEEWEELPSQKKRESISGLSISDDLLKARYQAASTHPIPGRHHPSG